MLNRFEVAEELEENLSKIKDLLESSRQVLRSYDRETYEDANASVFSHIDTALDDDHSWIGRNMMTFEKLVNTVRDDY